MAGKLILLAVDTVADEDVIVVEPEVDWFKYTSRLEEVDDGVCDEAGTTGATFAVLNTCGLFLLAVFNVIPRLVVPDVALLPGTRVVTIVIVLGPIAFVGARITI